MTIHAVMLMGARKEPFLAACLNSLHLAVDHVILNDNSGLDDHDNLATVQSSQLFREGKIDIIRSTFLGFGPCRDLCLDHIRRNAGENTWVIFVDCDEVHPTSLTAVTRQILPSLPSGVGVVEGYVYNFFQSPQFFTTLDHRHNLMFRFNPSIHWQGNVHEKLTGQVGSRLVLPYRYYHYGYLATPETIEEKWRQYGTLGDAISGKQSERVLAEILGNIPRMRRFSGQHPECVRQFTEQLAATESEFSTHLLKLVEARPGLKCHSQITAWRIAVKMMWLKVHVGVRYPSLWSLLADL